MLYTCLTVLLFCVSLLPSAYLRYYPFRLIATPSIRHFLVAGHMLIFFAECILLGLLFNRGILILESGVFQKLYLYCYIPHLLLLMFTIRPYWFRHLFVLGLQAIYMLFIHTFTMEIFKHFWPQYWLYDQLLSYFCLYIPLFLLGMPLMERILGKLFTTEQLTKPRHSFWVYLGPVPLLLCYYHGNMGYFLLDPSDLFRPSLQIYTLITRIILLVIGGFLIMSIRDSNRQIKKMFQVKEQNLQIQDQLEQINEYAASLHQEQQELSILRHDSRHQLRMLAELVESGHYQEAEKQLLQMQKDVKRK